MLFSVLHRIQLGQVLPSKGTFEDLIIREDILDKVKITQEEITEFEIKTIENRLQWNGEKAKDIEIELTNAETEHVKKALKDLSEKKELDASYLSLYKLFNS